MTNFDMKQWLQENRVGPYRGLLKEDLGDPQARADHGMEEEDDENGDMVDNVSMAEVRGSYTFNVDLKDKPFIISRKEYIVSGEVDVEISSDEEGFVIDHAAITITDLHEEDEENDEQYTKIEDSKKVEMLQDLINTDEDLQDDLKDAVADKIDFGDLEDDSDWSGSEVDEQMGVGYASITKPSDPNRRPPLEM